MGRLFVIPLTDKALGYCSNLVINFHPSSWEQLRCSM